MIAINRRRMMGNNKETSQYVDLGLPSGRLWATCNVGASKPSEKGLFFSFGNTDGHVDAPYDGYSFSQANYNSSAGANVEYDIPLEQDAAYINMGVQWRMARYADYIELDANCTRAWTIVDGSGGMLFTSNNNGNTLFFPAGGYKLNAAYYSNGYGYYYFGDCPYIPGLGYTNRLYFSQSTYAIVLQTRYIGHNVRGVLI